MKLKILFLLVCCVVIEVLSGSLLSVYGQNTAVTLSGVVKDKEGRPLTGVSIFLKGLFTGTVSNTEGKYLLKLRTDDLPGYLVFSYSGFNRLEIAVSTENLNNDVVLNSLQSFTTNAIITSASRNSEQVMQAPAYVDIVQEKEIVQRNTVELFNYLSHLGGVDVSSSSMLCTSISPRGFNSPRSERMLHMVDYMDTQSPSMNINFGNILNTIDLDVSSVELLHGPVSALYGANALNGLLLINTKDAFIHEGLSVMLKGGSQNLFDAQLRYATKINNFWAFKINASVFLAKEWLANNVNALSSDPLNHTMNSSLGYNAINRYGEIGLNIDLDNDSLHTKETRIYTPGWSEEDLLREDDGTKVFRINPSLSYLLTDKIKATIEANALLASTIYQFSTRTRLKNYTFSQLKAALESDRWAVRAYHSRDNAGESYDLNLLATYLMQAPVSNLYTVDSVRVNNYSELYFNNYISAYQKNNGSFEKAQSIANTNFPKSTGDEFLALRDQVIASDVAGKGAKIRVNSNFTDVSAQYSFKIKALDQFTLGTANRWYQLESQGHFFADTVDVLNNYQLAAFGVLERSFAKKRIKLAAVVRIEDTKNFKIAFTNRFSAVVALDKKKQHNLRFSYADAFRNPSQFDQYALYQVGSVTILGNVGKGFSGYDIAVLSGGSPDTYKVSINPLKQEYSASFEVGYRTFIKEKLALHLSYYQTQYKDFITARRFVGRFDGALPNLAAGEGTLIQVWTNVDETVKTKGGVLGIDYNFIPALGAKFNYTYIKLQPTQNSIDFNTPESKFNIGFYGVISKRYTYNINYRWADEYVYSSPFAAGIIAPTALVDAYFGYTVPSWKSTFSLTLNNIFDEKNIQTFGGPHIGRMVVLGILTELK